MLTRCGAGPRPRRGRRSRLGCFRLGVRLRSVCRKHKSGVEEIRFFRWWKPRRGTCCTQAQGRGYQEQPRTTPPQVRGYQEHPRTSHNRGPEAHSSNAKLRCAKARRDVVRYVAGRLFDVRVAITHHKKKKKKKNRLPGVGLGLGLGEGEGAGLGVSGSGCGFGVSGTCMALKSRVCQTK